MRGPHLPPPQVAEQEVQDCQSPRTQSTRAGKFSLFPIRLTEEVFFQIPKCERKSSPSTVNHAVLLVAVSSLVLPTQEYRPSSFALNSLALEQSQPRTCCHLALLVSLQSLFTKEPVNIQGRTQLWIGGEDALQGGFFALLDREVIWLLNHARSLQNSQVLENNIGEESDGIN